MFNEVWNSLRMWTFIFFVSNTQLHADWRWWVTCATREEEKYINRLNCSATWSSSPLFDQQRPRYGNANRWANRKKITWRLSNMWTKKSRRFDRLSCIAQKYPVVTTSLSIAWPSEFPNIFLGDTSSWCIYMCILLSRVRERKMLKFYNTSSKHDTGADNFFALTHSKTLERSDSHKGEQHNKSYRIAIAD